MWAFYSYQELAHVDDIRDVFVLNPALKNLSFYIEFHSKSHVKKKQICVKTN